jgi:hypothetical protein
MAVDTEHMIQLIAKQADDKGLGVCSAPKQDCRLAAAEHTHLKTTVRRFQELSRAPLPHSEPSLNDGVILNITPLSELVPWKEDKKYWNELIEGRHAWSAIGKQLRQKGRVK